MENNYLTEIEDYWKKRSNSYGKQHQVELENETKMKWQDFLLSQFDKHSNKVNHILDVGTGPGFLAIALAEKKYNVTAIDITKEMLGEAKKNAGLICDDIDWKIMNAEKLDFPDNYFDAIVTRNLTWNLEHPEKAYQEWKRVLKKDGILLNFDANWYNHLFDEESRKKYEASRRHTEESGVQDFFKETDIKKMESLAYHMPLSSSFRPEWDVKKLKELDFQEISCCPDLTDKLLSEAQKINNDFVPFFMIKAIK